MDPDVFALYMQQETLLNLLLRNYLHYNLYDQAEKLRSKTQRLESHSNQQVISLRSLFVSMIFVRVL